MSINRVVLTGRLTRDVELKATSTGNNVASFTVAVDGFTKDQNGETTSSFINCVAWNKTAETMDKYVKKGMLIAVEGRLQTRNYENKDGNKVYVTEVVCDNMRMLESKNSSNTSSTYLEDYEPSNNGYQSDN